MSGHPLAVSQGTAVLPIARDGVPYCSPRCMHRTDLEECDLAPGQKMDTMRVCVPFVASMAMELEAWRDRAVNRRAAAVSAPGAA